MFAGEGLIKKLLTSYCNIKRSFRCSLSLSIRKVKEKNEIFAFENCPFYLTCGDWPLALNFASVL
jgi:hypothetical protein